MQSNGVVTLWTDKALQARKEKRMFDRRGVMTWTDRQPEDILAGK